MFHMRTVITITCVTMFVATLRSLMVSAQSPQLLLQGRFQGDVDLQTGLATLPLLFSWPASSVHATFTGSSVNATLSAVAPAVNYDAYSRFAFFIDQQQVAIESTTPSQMTITWSAAGLGPGAPRPGPICRA